MKHANGHCHRSTSSPSDLLRQLLFLPTPPQSGPPLENLVPDCGLCADSQLPWGSGGALPPFHMSPSSSAGQTGSPAPLLPPPPPHCLSVRLQVRNMMEGDFWTVRRLSPFVPPAEWEWKLDDRREVQMSVVGRRDKSGDPQWL